MSAFDTTRPPRRCAVVLGSFSKGNASAVAAERVAQWTRERFELSASDPVLVAQLACGLPGCPPLETVVAFWTPDGLRHGFKVFKPVAAVTPDDLPYEWLKRALVAPDAIDCC